MPRCISATTVGPLQRTGDHIGAGFSLDYQLGAIAQSHSYDGWRRLLRRSAKASQRTKAVIADHGILGHINGMCSAHSKSERMALRRAVGNRALPTAPVTAVHRGPECLWPHACFACHKSWKLSEKSKAKCPQCGGDLHWMGRAFKVPKKGDQEQWAKIETLWLAGFRFFNSPSRKGAVELFPDRLRDVADFVRRNPSHPFRVVT